MANSLDDLLTQAYESIASGDITPFDESLIQLAAEHWNEPAHQAQLLNWYSRLGVQLDARKSLVSAIERALVERLSGDGEDALPSPWDARKHISVFLDEAIEMPDSLVSDLVFPSAVTVIAAPSATGKTICVHILAYELARGGIFRGDKLDMARVLVVDTDNPPAEVQRRLKHICQHTDIKLEIITRESAPLLTDDAAWKRLPAKEFDVIILDSFGGATPGVSEREGAKTQTALRTLTDLADQGPAIVVLENTSKNALSYRGRGEKVERVEMFFEARDVTGWTPPSGDDWWEHLPDAGDTEWQKRASRRNRADKSRVAFICRKARLGSEPPPFVLEVNFTAIPWSVRDATQDVELAGQEYSQNEQRAYQQRLKEAATALATLVQERYDAGDPLGKTDAENFLMKRDLKRQQARNLITSFDENVYPGRGSWAVSSPKGWGSKKALLPMLPSANSGATAERSGLANILSRKDLDTESFCQLDNMRTAERLAFTPIENKGVTESNLSAAEKNHSGCDPILATRPPFKDTAQSIDSEGDMELPGFSPNYARPANAQRRCNRCGKEIKVSLLTGLCSDCSNQSQEEDTR